MSIDVGMNKKGERKKAVTIIEHVLSLD